MPIVCNRQAPMRIDTPVSIVGSTPTPGTTMYKVSNLTDQQYGKVVAIERAEDGDIETPFFAWQRALTQRRFWREQGAKNVRYLVVGQIMTSKQLELWSYEEYKSLPKCTNCAKILGGDVYTHRYCGHSLFCTQACADTHYHQEMDKLKDEEEIDYF